jgi:hypothetical protein
MLLHLIFKASLLALNDNYHMDTPCEFYDSVNEFTELINVNFKMA